METEIFNNVVQSFDKNLAEVNGLEEAKQFNNGRKRVWVSTLDKRILEAQQQKIRRVHEQKQLLAGYYTDIFSHNYDPYNGSKLAIGTSQGNLTIMSTDPFKPPGLQQRLPMYEKKPVTALHWGQAGICVSSSKYFQFYLTSAENCMLDSKPTLSFMTPSTIFDLCNISAFPERVAMVCKHAETRIYDINAHKLLNILMDHKSNATVCASSEKYFVTGGSDGSVFVYDASLRSPDPIWEFCEKSQITALSMSSMYLAVAQKNQNTPKVFNFCGKFKQGEVQMPDNLEVNAVALGNHGDVFWGGTNGQLYYTEDSTRIRKLNAVCGGKRIRAIKSIALPPTKEVGVSFVSIAGNSNGVLIANRGCKYWDNMIHMINEDETKVPETVMTFV